MEIRQLSLCGLNQQVGGKSTAFVDNISIDVIRIGSEKRPEKQHYVPPTPGPGSYNLTQVDMGKNGPKYSAKKRPANLVKDSPGPGAYQPVV